MTITTTVEDENSEETIEVEFEADVIMIDDSYDDEYGTVKKKPYPSIESEITWDKTIYDNLSNYTIHQWLQKNKTLVEKIFLVDYMDD